MFRECQVNCGSICFSEFTRSNLHSLSPNRKGHKQSLNLVGGQCQAIASQVYLASLAEMFQL